MTLIQSALLNVFELHLIVSYVDIVLFRKSMDPNSNDMSRDKASRCYILQVMGISFVTFRGIDEVLHTRVWESG